jgi:hypothetical protein
LAVGTDTLVDFTDNYYLKYSSSNYLYNPSDTKRKTYTLSEAGQIKAMFLRISVVSNAPGFTGSVIVSYSLDGNLVQLLRYTTTASNGSGVIFNITTDAIYDRIDIFAGDPIFTFTVTWVSHNSSNSMPTSFASFKPYLEIKDISNNRTAEIYETGTALFKRLQVNTASVGGFLYTDSLRVLETADIMTELGVITLSGTDYSSPILVQGYSYLLVMPYRLTGDSRLSSDTFIINLLSTIDYSSTARLHKVIMHEGGTVFQYNIEMQRVNSSGTASATEKFIAFKSNNSVNANTLRIYGIKGPSIL